MNRGANPGQDLEISKLAAVRAAWIRAVEASDINGLIALATDDIVLRKRQSNNRHRCLEGASDARLGVV